VRLAHLQLLFYRFTPSKLQCHIAALGSHTCVSKWYNLTLVKGPRLSAAEKMTVGLVSNNSSLPTGLLLTLSAGSRLVMLEGTGVNSKAQVLAYPDRLMDLDYKSVVEEAFFKVNSERVLVSYSFWATVCKTVRPMLSVRCLSVLSVCL